MKYRERERRTGGRREEQKQVGGKEKEPEEGKERVKEKVVKLDGCGERVNRESEKTGGELIERRWNYTEG